MQSSHLAELSHIADLPLTAAVPKSMETLDCLLSIERSMILKQHKKSTKLFKRCLLDLYQKILQLVLQVVTFIEFL
jgi:hypothetical protein